MSQTTPSVMLKILSGPHTGAEMALGPGDWSIGSDIACDLVLADPGVENEHALLSVGIGGDVRLSPLHGAVARLGEARVPDGGTDLPWYTLFTLGSTGACVGSAEETWPEDVPASIVSQPSTPIQPDALADAPSAGALPEDAFFGTSSNTAPPSSEPSATGEADPARPSADEDVSLPLSRFRRLSAGGVSPTRRIAVAVLLLALITGTSGLGFLSPDTPEEQAERMRQILRAEGLDALQVLRTPQGTLRITGVVPLPADKSRLEAVLASADSGTPPDTELRVTVADTLARELRTTFERAGARLRVDRLGTGLRISGYIYDAAYLDKLLAPHEEALDEVLLKFHTVFWNALEPELEKLTAAYRLQDVVHFDPSPLVVRVRAPRLTAVTRAALVRLEAEVTDLAQGASPFEQADGPVSPVAASHSAPRREAAVPLCRQLRFAPGIRGRAATLQLDTRTYDEGGRLPGGYRISELTAVYAVLVRDGNEMLLCRKYPQQPGE